MNGRTAAGVAVVAALAGLAAIPFGCGSSPPPSAGGTGAFGVVTVNGKQKLYLPVTELTDGGNGQIAVVDVGVTGNGVLGAPALVTNIDLGSNDAGVLNQATTTNGDATVIVAAGTNTYNVWFISPITDTITKVIQLDPSLNGSQFSGGGGIVTGIAMDEANHRAVLSVWDGFVYIDLTSQTVAGGVLTAPSENFGFDSASELVLAPFYNCGDTSLTGNGLTDAGPPCQSYLTADGGAVITAGLNVINLHTNKIYTYENPGASDPTEPLGGEPDSASVDVSTGLAVIPSEGNSYENFMDLSKATFNDTTNTFTAPVTVYQAVSDTGVAVEPSSHLAFFEAEHESHVSVVDLSQLVQDGGFPLNAEADGEMPNTPAGDAGAGGGWSNLGDPHGVAVTTAIQGGAAVGFVVNDTGDGPVWVARIDLKKMLSLSGLGTEVADLSPAVTMLDATTKE